jgi:tetratricopeptide (TPR) repeat protein
MAMRGMKMRKFVLRIAATAALFSCASAVSADPQMGGMGGGMGGMGPGGRSGAGPGDSSMQLEHKEDKPEIQAKKAYKTALKSLDKAKAYTLQAQQEKNADKQIAAQQKATEAYSRALDWFTETLSNNSDMVEAWNGAGYAHLHIGAYGEALDDYNHDLKLNPTDMDAIANRAEACLQLGRLDDVQVAYLDLFNHARERADQLMRSMQHWVSERRTDPQGIKAADLDTFQRWIDEHLKAAGA